MAIAFLPWLFAFGSGVAAITLYFTGNTENNYNAPVYQGADVKALAILGVAASGSYFLAKKMKWVK